MKVRLNPIAEFLRPVEHLLCWFPPYMEGQRYCSVLELKLYFQKQELNGKILKKPRKVTVEKTGGIFSHFEKIAEKALKAKADHKAEVLANLQATAKNARETKLLMDKRKISRWGVKWIVPRENQ